MRTGYGERVEITGLQGLGLETKNLVLSLIIDTMRRKWRKKKVLFYVLRYIANFLNGFQDNLTRAKK